MIIVVKGWIMVQNQAQLAGTAWGDKGLTIQPFNLRSRKYMVFLITTLTTTF